MKYFLLLQKLFEVPEVFAIYLSILPVYFGHDNGF
jgi:hypothetical protein